MIGENSKQIVMEFVSIDSLVPEDHLLRKIDSAIDFSFIRQKVKDLYCKDNGRPSLDPVVLFKMLFIGYLYGIRSERQLVREVEVNIAYRWFLGFGLESKVPHHSTISQNRRRRFSYSHIYQEIFDEIVIKAIRKKMVDGKVLYTDSTHLKANANKHKQQVKRSTRVYLESLEQDILKDRQRHSKKALKRKDKEEETKEIKQSTTDPDSGYMVRDGKPQGFFYLDHRTVDGKFNIITDTHVTPGNGHDSIPYLERLDHQIQKFGFRVESVGLDAGYSTAPICKGLVEREIYGVIGYNRPRGRKGFFRKRDYRYDQKNQCYICPASENLDYRTTSRSGYREYASNPQICCKCKFLSNCTGSKTNQKVITRHIWQDYKDKIDKHRLEPKGKNIYRRRKETVERSFADAKQLHGHRYARMRGIEKVREQALLAAACQNIKKIALHYFTLLDNINDILRKNRLEWIYSPLLRFLRVDILTS